MCLQCITDAIYIAEIAPNLHLMKAQTDAPDEWLAGWHSTLDQYCRIIFRPVSLENDLYRQWHKHAGFKFLFERKTTEPATSEN